MAVIFDGRFIGTFPGYTGWTQDPSARGGYNTFWTITQLAGQAPSGNDAVRHDEITKAADDADVLGGTDETSAWWSKTGLTAPAQGTTWYLKYRFKINGAQSWVLAVDSTNTVIKAAVIGDGGASGNRVITHIRAAPTSGQINIAAGLSTGSETGYTSNLSQDTWHSVQLAVQSGTTAGAADGSLKLYIDNDNPDAPNGTGSNLIIPTSDWDESTRFGAGTLRAILTGNNFSMIWADFMIEDTFDTAWYSSMTPATSRGTNPTLMVGVL